MADKLPFMPFYINDWETDSRVRQMGPTARSFYLTLLIHQWREGYIPADDAQLWNLLLMPPDPSDEARILEQVKECFQPLSAGRLANHQLDIIRKKHVALASLRSAAGKSGRSKQIRNLMGLAQANAGESESDTESDTDITSSEHKEHAPQKTPLSPSTLAEIWQDERGSLAKIREFTRERQAKCQARIKSHSNDPESYLASFRQGVRQAAKTPFLCGENDNGWRASFDWFIANDTNLSKVLEGRYDARQAKIPVPRDCLAGELKRPEFNQKAWVEQTAHEIVTRKWPYKAGSQDADAQKLMAGNRELAECVKKLERLK
jgi:uncharacterized protein YdaU (DUF1376 family)